MWVAADRWWKQPSLLRPANLVGELLPFGQFIDAKRAKVLEKHRAVSEEPRLQLVQLDLVPQCGNHVLKA